MKNLNLFELLKDCPKGTKLYTTVWGEVELINLSDVSMIKVLPTSNPYNTSDTKLIYSDGRFTLDGECILFPSKENRDWSKFHRPFEDGDILTNERGSIFIYKGPMYYNKQLADFYCGYRISDKAFVPKLFKDKHFGDISELRFATEEEKQKLFDAIKANGYKWNAETKTLEKLIKPKFKVGDRITNGKISITIGYIDSEYYYEIGRNIATRLFIKNQDDWELAPTKFDITTLKPFDQVLVRNTNKGIWHGQFYMTYNESEEYPFICTYNCWQQCIPYKGNEYLCGTTDECNEFYKTWE